MLNFGTSAYLKLLAMNPKPKDTEIRKRLQPSVSGYDYYRAMRRIGMRRIAGIDTPAETAASLRTIKKLQERADATAAIKQLMLWSEGRNIRIIPNAGQYAASPSNVFSVKFQPDFETDIDGVPTQIHIWNTQKPTPKLREAIGALGLFSSEENYSRQAILSLRTGELFVAQNVESAKQLAILLARDIEKRIERIADEMAIVRGTTDRPDRAATQ